MLKIGLLGVGHLGKIHLKLLKEIKDFEVVGFYDHDEPISFLVEKEFGVKAYNSFEELAAMVDVVDIVTPATAHYEYATQCLRMSKHVFVEKPLTYSVSEAKELVSLANEANVKVQVGHVERFNPAFLAAKPFIMQPMFIDCERMAPFNPRGMDVSVVLDVMIHDIDWVLHVVNSRVKRISATGASIIGKTPDMVNARLEFDNGCIANLSACRIFNKTKRKSKIFQSGNVIDLDFGGKKCEIISLMAPAGNIDGKAFAEEFETRKGGKILHFELPKIVENNAIKAELESFAKAILEDTTTAVTIEDGYEALNVAHKIDLEIKKRF